MRFSRLLLAAALLAPLLRQPAAAQSIAGELPGTVAGARYGQALSCRGPRVVIGAPGTPNGSGTPNAGAATLEFPLGVIAPRQFPPLTSAGFERFGESVLVIDDVSGDSAPDYAIGAPGALTYGAIFVYFDPGAAAFGPADLIMVGTQTGEEFGSSMTILGDRDGDGTNELLVGSPALNSGGGTTRVVDLIAESTTNGPMGVGNERLGTSVAPLGDLNADTILEAAAGGPGYILSAGFPQGRVHIFDTQDFITQRIIGGVVVGELFGSALANVGDVDGDGVGDLLVGSPAGGFTPAANGSAYLYSGGTLLSANPTRLCTIGAAGSGPAFGSAVSGIGSILNNGRLQFAVGSSEHNNGAGQVVIYEYVGGVCVALGTFEGPGGRYELGVSLSGNRGANMCDFNADGTSDFVAGTRSDVNGAESGSVAVFIGITPTPTATPTPSPTATPTATPTPEPPTSADLQFRIETDGNLTGSIVFNRDPAGACQFEILSRITTGDRRTLVTNLGSGTADAVRVPFAAGPLPQVRTNNCVRPVGHLVARVTCGADLFFSNVFARYLNCGTGAGASEREWFDSFSASVTFSSAARIKIKKVRGAKFRRNSRGTSARAFVRIGSSCR